MDVVDLLEKTNGRLDLIMIPKAGNARATSTPSTRWSPRSRPRAARTKPLGFEAIIETAAGLAHVEEIAAGSKRMQSLHLGPADYAAYMGMATTHIGGTQSNYYMLERRRTATARARCITPTPGTTRWWRSSRPAAPTACCRSTARSAISPTPRASARRRCARRRSAASGKWAIHPSQVALSNEIFTPSEAAVADARAIMAAMEQAKAEGKGAVTYKGKLIDIASIKQAEVIVRQSEMIAGGSGSPVGALRTTRRARWKSPAPRRRTRSGPTSRPRLIGTIPTWAKSISSPAPTCPSHGLSSTTF
jgi:malyl-CoA/(S)-citramalyl-CoA lyase